MKQIFFSSAIILTFSQSFAFAMQSMLDRDFEGDTLVIGGTTNKHPNRLSVNISGGDIRGSGWDEDFLKDNFTQGKYSHILYEHVGYSLAQITAVEYEIDASSDNLAKIHFSLLKPGGTFDFLSWGYFFSGIHSRPSEAQKELENIKSTMQNYGLRFKYTKDSDKYAEYIKKYKKSMILVLESDNNTNFADYNHIPSYYINTVDVLNNNKFVTSTISSLNFAGFKEIQIQYEKNGVLGFTESHGSLHISAKKPD